MRMEELPLPLTNFSNQAPEKALHFHRAKEKSWPWCCEFRSAEPKGMRGELTMLFAVHCIWFSKLGQSWGTSTDGDNEGKLAG